MSGAKKNAYVKQAGAAVPEPTWPGSFAGLVPPLLLGRYERVVVADTAAEERWWLVSLAPAAPAYAGFDVSSPALTSWPAGMPEASRALARIIVDGVARYVDWPPAAMAQMAVFGRAVEVSALPLTSAMRLEGANVYSATVAQAADYRESSCSLSVAYSPLPVPPAFLSPLVLPVPPAAVRLQVLAMYSADLAAEGTLMRVRGYESASSPGLPVLWEGAIATTGYNMSKPPDPADPAPGSLVALSGSIEIPGCTGMVAVSMVGSIDAASASFFWRVG